MMLPLYRNAQW